MSDHADVMLWLGINDHIGIPDWNFLVFEGQGGERLECARKSLVHNFPEATVVAQEVQLDGDSPQSPVVLLRNA